MSFEFTILKLFNKILLYLKVIVSLFTFLHAKKSLFFMFLILCYMKGGNGGLFPCCKEMINSYVLFGCNLNHLNTTDTLLSTPSLCLPLLCSSAELCSGVLAEWHFAHSLLGAADVHFPFVYQAEPLS